MSALGSEHYLSLDKGEKKPLGWGGRVAIIVSAAAIVIFAFSVMLGNFLRNRAGEMTDEENSGTGEVPAVLSFQPSPTLTARVGVLLPGSADTTEAETSAPDTPGESEAETTQPPAPADALEYNAVSLLLRDRDGGTENGAVLYVHSAASGRIGADRVAEGAPGLADGVRDFKIAGEYVSAVFYLSYPTEPEATRAVMRSYEMSLLREIAVSGADEIVLFGGWKTRDALAEVLGFCAELREKTTVTLGVALDCDYLLGAEAGEQLNELSTSANGVFLALDLRSISVPSLMTAEDVIGDRVARTSELVLKYAMRVLVGCGSAPDYPAQMRCARAAGAVSVQAVPAR